MKKYFNKKLPQGGDEGLHRTQFWGASDIPEILLWKSEEIIVSTALISIPALASCTSEGL